MTTTVSLAGNVGAKDVYVDNTFYAAPTSAVTINAPAEHLASFLAAGYTFNGESGNAATATALQTARTIDGRSFDGTANITVVGPATHAATGKTTPVDADELPISDSAAAFVLKKLTWANIKATLKAYFDTLYPSGSGTSSGTNTGDQTTVSGNAGSATVLAAARTINGVSFNGSANITVPSMDVYAGYVGADGTTGNRLPAGWSAAKTATGEYDITHSLALAGGKRLSVSITPVVATGGFGSVISETANASHVGIIEITGGVLADEPFYFAAKVTT